MSKNLAVLEQRGLLRREVDAGDNRVQKLFLTTEGKRVWRIAERLGRRMEEEMFGELSQAQWRELHRLLDAVLPSFQHWRDRQSPDSGDALVRERDED